MRGLDGDAISHVSDNTLWRGVDLSGTTLVLGVGTGRLIALLQEQVAIVNGSLVVLHVNLQEIKTLLLLQERGLLTLIQGRPRQIPLLDETVDLLVVNGLLREVPESKIEMLFEELWRVLVPGGQVRVSDIIEPSEAECHHTWAERNRVVRKLGQALQKPTALAVNLPLAAKAARAVGFEDLSLAFLPGYPLTDAWLQDTVNAVRNLAGRVVDRALRHEVLDQDLPRLIAAYAEGGQRASERFVLQAKKEGDQALAMQASFTEEDLAGPQE